jgi:hypothetical protein
VLGCLDKQPGETMKQDTPLRIITSILFLCIAGQIAIIQTDIKRQENHLAQLQSKLPLTITVYVSPELGHASQMKVKLPGLPTWQSIAATAGHPYK